MPMLLYGFIGDKTGAPMPDVTVEIKDHSFQTLFTTQSNSLGHYRMDLPAGTYPFVAAVRDYAQRYLEYWCTDLCLTQDTELSFRIDTLEVYGLNCFQVAGAYPALFVYFRPMSLSKFQAQAEDIAPDLREIRVTVDGKNCAVLVTNPVRESIGDRELTAYLIQAEYAPGPSNWDRLDLEIVDADGNYGAASLYHRRHTC